MADDHSHSALGFAESVKSNFLFLKTAGFRCACLKPELVKFESPKVNVQVLYYRFEMDLEVEEPRSPSESYPLLEVLMLADRERAKGHKIWMASTPQSFAEGIRQIAEHFKYCLGSGIFNDPSIFTRLREQRKILARNYMHDMRMEAAMRELELAWKNRNFKKVIEILSPLQEHLNATELKKLEYAKNHFRKV